MINAFQSLTKGPLAEKIYDLKPIGNMILQHHIIVSSFVVISIIIGEIPVAFDLFWSESEIVTGDIIDELTLFILCEAWSSQEVL